jgi:hypothetical protein
VNFKNILILFVLSVLLTTTPNVKAEEPTSPPAPAVAVPQTKSTHFTLAKGGFFQGGALLGYALNPLDALSTGVSTALGYQINSHVGLYVRSDFFGILDDSGTHLGFTFIPSTRITIIDNLYGFAGVGYALTAAPKESSITDTTSVISRSYHSFTIEGGLGYVFLFNKSFGLFGEAGVNYTYISKADFVQTEMWRPFGRAGVSLQF